jgi:hypothetical protein
VLDLITERNFKEKCLWRIEDIKLNNPVILNQLEKEWIENQASKMSKEIGVKITTSAWMRMTLLKDMMTKE